MGLRRSGMDLPKAVVVSNDGEANKPSGLGQQANTIAASDPATGAGGLQPHQDGIEPASQPPGAAFINSLVGLDRNGDGAIKGPELDKGMVRLNALARDGRGNDAAEIAIVAALERAVQAGADVVAGIRVQDGRIELSIEESGYRESFVHAPVVEPADVLECFAEVGGVPIRHGDDPGDYYCEHMFYSAQLEASEPGSSVLLNSSGEPLVGFLHVRSDGFVTRACLDGYDLESRHADTRNVIGAAIRGYYDALVDQVKEGPVRILLTGYGSFMGITNNPTGEFVGQRENIDAAMQKAFGDRLVKPEGEPVSASGDGDLPAHATAYRYWVRNPWTGEEREVIVAGAEFPVEDAAINPSGSGSVQALMRAFSPQAVISMGVAGVSFYMVEHRADSGGLSRVGDSPRHDWSASDSGQLRDNYSLARAIQHGAPLIERSSRTPSP